MTRNRRSAPNGWREQRRPDFRNLHAAVARIKHAPGSAVKAAVAIAERQRRYPHFRKIMVGYGGRGPKPGICDEAGMCRSSAIRGVAWLQRNGFFHRQVNPGGRGRANEYHPGPAIGGSPPDEPGPWDGADYDPKTWPDRLSAQRARLREAVAALAARPPPTPLRIS